jgi:hypothetical protein
MDGRGRGSWVVFGDVEAREVFDFLRQFMPDSNLQSALDILGDSVPIHVTVSILCDPDNNRKLFVCLCNERQIKRANFGNKSVSLGILQVA